MFSSGAAQINRRKIHMIGFVHHEIIYRRLANQLDS
jgi:hypothetical protein